MNLIDRAPARLHDLLTIERETGRIFWRERSADYFASDERCAAWNARYAGTEAFLGVDKDGYLQGTIFNKTYKAARVVWAYFTGKWPDGMIDHENRDVKDNRFDNLRDVTNQLNQRNCGLRKDNTSGYVGVSLVKRSGRYRARVKVDGETILLGTFDDPDQAFLARVSYLYHAGLIGNADGFTVRHGHNGT